MLWRIEVGPRQGVADVVGRAYAKKIDQELGITVDAVHVKDVYTVKGLEEKEISDVLSKNALHDPVLQDASLDPTAKDFDWAIEVGFRPGVTDNPGRTAKETLMMVLGVDSKSRPDIAVYTSKQFLLSGGLSLEDATHIAKDLLANELIQRFEIKSKADWAKEPGFEPKAANVTGQPIDAVETMDLTAMSDEELVKFSRENTLALSLEEMRFILDYFNDPEVVAIRKKSGLTNLPTDAELECLAQTWSEHCKHKIFNAEIDYLDEETGRRSTIDSLFKTYIQGSTKLLREKMGEDDFCLSVFKDNAGVIKFNDKMNVCIKVETHNSPSALDPYGGALTGIVGVNRDPMGTGMGANLLCNTDIFCFASPFWEGELPPRLLHPRRVLEGVREGVEHGGNKSGIPTVNGSFVFDERYLGKPLVYCGTVGTMPTEIDGRPSHEKYAMPGDVIVMTGGRIGKDGIHGATFSSEELHEGSPATAVQIGDPITQRKMYDFLMRARDMGLYNAITDNGAGGLSSSVGEMAQECGGCDMDLALAPLKYDGLRPWEILVSEAQERMTLAVPPEKLERFMELASEMDVEASALGEFNDSGVFKVTFGDKPVAVLDMDFLHDGVPQMKLSAVWKKPVVESKEPANIPDQGELLKNMLGRLNICSKEYVIRQYDHEVQGGSAIKPLVGVKRDGPADAGVVRPDLESERALVISHGICPRYGDVDAYWMVALAVDEAVRNAVAVGGDIRCMAACDNFCWCDPVKSESTPDGEYKLAQLVRANQALSHYCLTYGMPLVSGKDSMKNDYKGGGEKISIPPTVLISTMGVIEDVNKTATSDFKDQGDDIYILGRTYNELAKSEIEEELGASYAVLPQVDAVSARQRYLAVHEAITGGLVKACHDLSDGGLAVALAEMALGGRIGADVDLSLVPGAENLSELETLYSESASRFLVCVAPGNRDKFEALFKPGEMARIGSVKGDSLAVVNGDTDILNVGVEELADAFKSTMNW